MTMLNSTGSCRCSAARMTCSTLRATTAGDRSESAPEIYAIADGELEVTIDGTPVAGHAPTARAAAAVADERLDQDRRRQSSKWEGGSDTTAP